MAGLKAQLTSLEIERLREADAAQSKAKIQASAERAAEDRAAVAVAAADPKAGVSEDEIASRLVEGDIAGAAGVRESSIDFVLHVITDRGGAR